VNKRFNEIFKSIRTWSIRKPVSYKNKASRIKGLANNIPVIKNIKINRADSKDVKLLAKKHPELASLEMHLDIDDSSVEIIACSSLPATLENLNLSWTGLTDSSLAHLPVFSNLNTLAIAGSGSFSDEGFCSLDGNFMRNIRVVDVSFTSLSDEGVESLLSAFPGVQDINFSRNIKITDRSMHTIKKRVKHLKKLNVRETQVSDEGLELLRVFSELAFLNCSPGAISEETITMLQTSSPRLVLEARNEEDLEDEDDLPDLLSSDSDEESSGDE